MTDNELDSAFCNHLHDLALIRLYVGPRKPRRHRPAPPAPQPPKYESPYLTVEEAAVYCKVAVQTIYNHRRHIERQPGTGKLLFKRESLDKWLATRPRR